MNLRITGVMGALAGAACMVVVAGQQVTSAQATQSTTSTQASGTSADQQITVTGCIQREADYRRATNAGKGGAVGTGVGVGNEFILASAMTASGSTPTATGTSGAATAGATGTAGSSTTMAYELTGPNEGRAESLVGKRVEITGKVKGGDVAASGATGGPTGNVPLSQDLKLRELEISTIRETTGTCTATP